MCERLRGGPNCSCLVGLLWRHRSPAIMRHGPWRCRWRARVRASGSGGAHWVCGAVSTVHTSRVSIPHELNACRATRRKRDKSQDGSRGKQLYGVRSRTRARKPEAPAHPAQPQGALHTHPPLLPSLPESTRAVGARAVSADNPQPRDILLPYLHYPYLPEQCRRCTPKPETVSKERPHASQGNCPKASCRTSPVAPARKREAQAAQSVRAPAGPGPLPLVSWAWHSHQLQRHAPPSQSRECTPSARNVSKVRSHRSHG